MSNEEISGNWDEDFNSESNSKPEGEGDFRKVEYMDMSKPGSYKIRLVGSHVKIRKHWSPIRATVRDDGKAIDPAWKAGFVPGRRFAINVIDKTNLDKGETGSLKVLEKGATVFKAFAAYKAATGIDPAGKEGPDFVVTVTVPMKDGKPNKMKTEYSVIPVAPAPFTEDEVKMLSKKQGGIGLWPLKEIYKPATAEKLQELWDAVPDDKKIAPKKPWENDEGEDERDNISEEKPQETTSVMDNDVGDEDDPADLF